MNGIKIVGVISDSHTQNALWEIYRQSFQGKELECAQNQKCYDEQSFKAALADPDYYKYYLVHDDEVVAYMLATNNLQKASITYMNPERYLMLFPEYAPDRIYYCTSLAVKPGKRNSRFFYELMSAYLEHILARLEGMHAFDFSHETIPNLPSVLEKIGAKLVETGKIPTRFTYQKVGAQEFGALVPQKTS